MTAGEPESEPEPFVELPDMESVVLGCTMLDSTAASIIFDAVRQDHFAEPRSRAVFAAAQMHAPEDGRADVAIVVDDLLKNDRRDAAGWAVKCIEKTPTTANAALYVGALVRAWARRVEKEAASHIGNGSSDAEMAFWRDKSEAARLEAARASKLRAAAAASSWDFADLAAEVDDPPPDEFVSRLFVRPSFNIVFGPPQAGKSWAVMALCLDAVMGGGNFLGCEELYVKPLREIRDGRAEKCLWVFGSEDTKARVKRRLKILHASGPHAADPIPKGAFIVATPPGGMSIHMPDGWAWLVKKVAETHCTLLVLDTISSLTGNSLDVNKAEQVIPFISEINTLRAERNLIAFGLHHTRKGSADAKKTDGVKADAMLGAGAWRALSECVLMLDAQDGDTARVTALSIKSKDIDRPIPKLLVTLENPGGRFRELDEDEPPPAREEVKRAGRPPAVTAAQIVALREKHPDGVPWREIPEILGVVEKTWKNNSARLQDEVLKLGHTVIVGVLKWS